MGFYIKNEEGRIIGWVASEAEATALLEQVPADIYSFYIGGLSAEVSAFILKLNEQGYSGKSFFDLLREKYGTVPTKINPFVELKDIFLKHTSFFIKLRGGGLDTELAAKMLSVLKRTVPAGSDFFVIFEPREITESLSLSDTGETLEIWYALDVDETGLSHTEVVLMPAIT